MINFNNFVNNIATVSDYKNEWEDNKLPKDIVDSFVVKDSYIRHLHSSNYSLFKDGIIIDHFLYSNNDKNKIIQLNKQNFDTWLITIYHDSSKNDYQDFLCKEKDLVEALKKC